MYLLGYDIGSSSIKAALVRVEDGVQLAVVQYPSTEMEINSPQSGWAEQAPELWWDYLCKATSQLLKQEAIAPSSVKGIGIAYQMHGLVLVDKNQKVLRPSIIWCDSRAVEIGEQAFNVLGADYCLPHLLNSPGNFTASKLKWVKENESDIYKQIDKVMLPGDYIAMKLTGEVCTTISGLSEGVFWDFKKEALADELFDYYGIDKALIPSIKPTFSIQGKVTAAAAEATGLEAGTPVAYRAGDQPNNALTLNALNAGEVAATGGTSGVVYGIVDQANYDPQSRVNSFAHVNHHKDDPRIGVLLCINGAGSLYRWVRQEVAEQNTSYQEMELAIQEIPIGADGLCILPFGNGAERILSNANPGAQILHLDFNRHSRKHIYRAALEGIAFSFVYGMQIMKDMGLDLSVIRVGNDNLFQSSVFSTTIATLMDCNIEMMQTTGAIGAAKAAGVATGMYDSLEAAFSTNQLITVYKPDSQKEKYQSAYNHWAKNL